MILRYFQKGFNYSQDGPGNRLVYHLQGCNMTCPWCSNPEGMDILQPCDEKDTNEIINEIMSCTPMFFENGGVTFTGGEATLQIDAVFEIMSKVKEKGISTAIETNATVKGIQKLINVCDYWMIDFKSPNKDTLKEITGANLTHIAENILLLSKSHTLHLRIPLIHGFNDDKTSLENFKDFFLSVKNQGGNFDIEILPYHEYGKEKWQKCGKEYKVINGFVSNDTVNKFINYFKENGLTIIKT